MEESIKHLARLTNSKVEIIACDLHPKFVTTRLAQNLAEENGWQLLQIQHHHAHVSALMAEHGVDEIIGISCDGYGYGLNGEAWGGEILLCTLGSSAFKRLAHLQRQPMPGGDMATRYPFRMAAGILFGKADVEQWLLKHRKHLPHGEKEIEIILHQLEKRSGIVMTTSCGRVLDAISAVLSVCYERTYEGEPAMKLESAALKGRDVLKLKPIIVGDVLDTTELLIEIFENRWKYSVADLAYSAHAYLARGLAVLAVEKALEEEVKTIGFSGGVACNQILTLTMRRIVENSGLKFLVHEAVPSGDGGLSLGQAAAAAFNPEQ